MVNMVSYFLGDILENYDRYMGLNIFVDYVDELVVWVVLLCFEKVFELVCGMGIVSWCLCDEFFFGLFFFFIDLNVLMLNFV